VSVPTDVLRKAVGPLKEPKSLTLDNALVKSLQSDSSGLGDLGLGGGVGALEWIRLEPCDDGLLARNERTVVDVVARTPSARIAAKILLRLSEGTRLEIRRVRRMLCRYAARTAPRP
jgi:hypothetical protein